ncbi:MAG: ABC transporter ATP-binding protein [Rudaea sp.]|uniref:ABC transporter ATP-binding protein n=1 Tax=Rudaea sp. TaxID=2136325 RepID=UPI0039E58591
MGTIRVEGLGKYYKRYTSRWSRLAEWLDPQGAARHEKHWVLREVDFDIRKGESIGIIGHNGAGKSTLLKLITGTTQPSAGRIEVGGRISALLELGMGFHSQFTGRQNCYMSGQLLGYSNEEIAARMGEIEAFAEIGDYIDQPARTYSSGMQVRLAFSVATCMRPDVLIVDEALSVGDAYFQHKSFDRIRQFREQGTTLLFVSHSASAIKNLCDRALLLDRGSVVRDGAPDDVLDYYNAIIARREAEESIRVTESAVGGRTTRSGSRAASIVAVDLLDAQGRSARALRACEPAQIVLDVRVDGDIPELTAGVMIRDAVGNDVFGTNSFHHGQFLANPAAGSACRVRFNIDSLALGRGSYSLSAALHTRDTHVVDNFDWWDRAVVFQVVPGERAFSIGIADLPVRIAIETPT